VETPSKKMRGNVRRVYTRGRTLSSIRFFPFSSVLIVMYVNVNYDESMCRRKKTSPPPPLHRDLQLLVQVVLTPYKI
jgi:hypothetical protein